MPRGRHRLPLRWRRYFPYTDVFVVLFVCKRAEAIVCIFQQRRGFATIWWMGIHKRWGPWLLSKSVYFVRICAVQLAHYTNAAYRLLLLCVMHLLFTPLLCSSWKLLLVVATAAAKQNSHAKRKIRADEIHTVALLSYQIIRKSGPTQDR